MKAYKTVEWYGISYTSQLELHKAFLIGNVKREIETYNIYCNKYTYYENDGTFITSFINDASTGFSSQMTGIELKN